MPTSRLISFIDPTFFSLKTNLVMGQCDHPQFTGLAQPAPAGACSCGSLHSETEGRVQR